MRRRAPVVGPSRTVMRGGLRPHTRITSGRSSARRPDEPRTSTRPGADEVAVRLQRKGPAIPGADRDAVGVHRPGRGAAAWRASAPPPAGSWAADPDTSRRVRRPASMRAPGLTRRPRPNQACRADDQDPDRAIVHDGAIRLDPNVVPVDQVRNRPRHRTRPAEHALGPSLGVAPGDDGVPTGAGEQRQPAVHGDQVHRSGVAGRQRCGQELRLAGQAKEVRGGIAEVRPGCSRAPCPCRPRRCNRRPGCRPRPPSRWFGIAASLSPIHAVSVSGSRVAMVCSSAPSRSLARATASCTRGWRAEPASSFRKMAIGAGGVTASLYLPAAPAPPRRHATAARLGHAAQHLGGIVLVGRGHEDQQVARRRTDRRRCPADRGRWSAVPTCRQQLLTPTRAAHHFWHRWPLASPSSTARCRRLQP